MNNEIVVQHVNVRAYVRNLRNIRVEIIEILHILSRPQAWNQKIRGKRCIKFISYKRM